MLLQPPIKIPVAVLHHQIADPDCLGVTRTFSICEAADVEPHDIAGIRVAGTFCFTQGALLSLPLLHVSGIREALGLDGSTPT